MSFILIKNPLLGVALVPSDLGEALSCAQLIIVVVWSLIADNFVMFVMVKNLDP